jgi:hypothetical protein
MVFANGGRPLRVRRPCSQKPEAISSPGAAIRTPTRFLLVLSGSLTIRVDAVAVELGSGQVYVD